MKAYTLTVISVDRIGNNDFMTDEEYIMTSLVDEDVGKEIIKNIEHCEVCGLKKEVIEILSKSEKM